MDDTRSTDDIFNNAFNGIFDKVFEDYIDEPLLDASHARKRTDLAIKRINVEKDKNVTLVLSKILMAADKGESSYYHSCILSDYEEGRLRDAGYNVTRTNTYQETHTTITW